MFQPAFHSMPYPLRSITFATLLAAILSIPISSAAQPVPQQLQPPVSQKLLLRLHAQGDQIYTCKTDGAHFTWALKAPDAKLFTKDGKLFGKHFAGPSWQATDGSRITGKAIANAPSPDPDSIPWLLVNVVSHDGDGLLARVTTVQRLNTKGGKSPASGCNPEHDGQEVRAPYSADYLFYTP